MEESIFLAINIALTKLLTGFEDDSPSLLSSPLVET